VPRGDQHQEFVAFRQCLTDLLVRLVDDVQIGLVEK